MPRGADGSNKTKITRWGIPAKTWSYVISGRYHPRKPVVVFEVVNWFPDGEVLV